MPARFIYYFGNGQADGTRDDRAILGGKGANLAEMTRIGIPVPPGFTISTDACRFYLREEHLPSGLERQVVEALRRVEQDAGKQFGDADNPLLISVRSGAAVSMPGMMDTILNLGLNTHTVEGLARAANDERFAYDSYRRFVEMYAHVVLGVPRDRFNALLDKAKHARGTDQDTGLTVDDLRELTARFEGLVRDATGEPFPSDPEVQLWGAIEAVFRSWNVERAIAYRRVHGIPDYLGTAVNVVAMIYGNMGDDSGTGVCFTRDPGTGAREFFGEFLVNAQGEDVVAGIRTPMSIDEMANVLPEPYEQLLAVQGRLERHFRDMQDLEFTVERGKLFLLQTRTGKRTAAAAVRIAVDMVGEGLIDEREAVLRVDPRQIDQLLHPRVDPDAEVTVLATGLPASPGAAAGKIAFDPDNAAARAAKGETVVLVRVETSPDDFHGMVAARAVVTARGGMTSHAAVVARGMGKPCVAGAGELQVEEKKGVCSAGGRRLGVNDWITVDGTAGRVLLGEVPTVEQELSDDFRRLMGWADGVRRLGVRANADTPEDARKARELGAEGIGLCRTEHMFFKDGRIQAMREMILAADAEARRRALDKILPMQRDDFVDIFRAMDGYPVTIRLLDPPLHEFLPSNDEEAAEFAAQAGLDPRDVAHVIEAYRETNPMLGHRGVRLGISHPEITEMQATAIFEAALAVAREGIAVQPEVMVPLVDDVRELANQRRLIERVAEEVFEQTGRTVAYLVGTMIELPRAALMAGEIASEADFFSFGTNDLTQTTYGMSRDDAATFLPKFIELGIIDDDPFQVLDREGVGQLVQIGTWDGRRSRGNLKVGICGEHGGEPDSIAFFHDIGLDYVSCSPFRVPVARLAAAHAALQSGAPIRKVARARATRAEADATERLRAIRRTRAVPAPSRSPRSPDKDADEPTAAAADD